MNKQIYAVKDHPGAHVFLDLRETDSGTVADVQLIGAISPYSARPEDLTPFEPEENTINSQDKILILAQKAAITFSLDPGRIQRAANMARQENGIIPKGGYLEVKSESYNDYNTPKNKTYTVSKGTCTCPDHAKGNICKHRIAAWIYRELHPAPVDSAYFEKQYCNDCMLSHWLEIPRYGEPICHGKNYLPTNTANQYTRHSGRGFEVITINRYEANHV